MNKKDYDMPKADVAWCPGCGNFGILNIIKQALAELEIPPEKLVMVSGIGQAAKLPHYIRANVFNGLHGRAVPPATAIKAANPELTVLISSGDGDMYGEGGNHLLHAIRRNPDLTAIVHNNMVYGLTKGQASPTSQKGFKTPLQGEGVFEEPFNPLAFAVSLRASFVARCFSGHGEQSVEILKKAILHKGFSLVDVFQPCVTFNKLNSYKWFKENTYYLDESYDPENRVEAFKKAIETDRFPLGIFYRESKPTFTKGVGLYEENSAPLFQRRIDPQKLDCLFEQFR